MFRSICERKHEHITQNVYDHLLSHDHETIFRVNNKLVLPRYLMSKRMNALALLGLKLWNAAPNDIKQSAL